jgi:phosphomannomutase
MLGMALILQLLADRRATLAEIVAGYPPLLMSKQKVPLEGTFAADRISDALKLENPVTLDTQDGVKAAFADGWIHLRVSNTEGIVRVIAEAPDAGRVEALQKIARKALAASW